MAKYVGDLEKTCSAIWRKRVRRFGETRSAKTLEIWRNVVGDLEKLVRRKRWRFGEMWSAIWRNLFGQNVGDLEKRGRRFGETCLAKTLEIWRKVVGELEKLVRRKHCRFGEMWSAQLWRFRIGVRYGVAESSATVSGD